jgi:addiction module RelE/StbE family toxin
MKILYSPKFAREYKKLPLEIKKIAEKQEAIFRKNPFDKRLKTHKLSGALKDFWSLSIGYRYRIIFEFGDSDICYFHVVGDQDIYR